MYFSGGQTGHNGISTFNFKFDLEGQGQSLFKTIGILTTVFCTSDRNLLILAWTGEELWHGQAQNRVNLDFKSNLTIKVKVNCSTPTPRQNNRDLNLGVLHLWSKFGDPGLNGWGVMAQTSLGLTRGYAQQTQATTILEGQNWPRVKSVGLFITDCTFSHRYLMLQTLLFSHYFSHHSEWGIWP